MVIRDDKIEDKEDKEHQFNLAKQANNDEAQKAFHICKDTPQKRKQSNYRIMANKKEAELLEIEGSNQR